MVRLIEVLIELETSLQPRGVGVVLQGSTLLAVLMHLLLLVIHCTSSPIW